MWVPFGKGLRAWAPARKELTPQSKSEHLPILPGSAGKCSQIALASEPCGPDQLSDPRDAGSRQRKGSCDCLAPPRLLIHHAEDADAYSSWLVALLL